MIEKTPTVNLWKFLPWVPDLFFNPLPTIQRITAKYGDIINFNLSKTQKLILVNHPDYVKHILKDNHENYSRRRAIKPLEPFLGEGLFMSEGKLWELQHQIMKPAFHEEQIKSYYACIKSETNLFIENWREVSKKELIDVELDINILMLSILIKTQFSLTAVIDCKEIIGCLRIILKSASLYNQKITFIKRKITRASGIRFSEDKKAKESLSRLNEIIRSIRDHAIEHPEETGFVLNVLETAKNTSIISDQQVIDEMMNFIFAGFDTTASALTWTLYCMATNTVYQDKLHKEFQKIMSGETTSPETFSQLDSVKMIVNESMRLYPPVWSFHRISKEEDTIKKYKIPANSYVMICPWALHRHPDLWERPNEFYPEHFNPRTFQGKAFTFIPFGQGKRMCVGKPMAMAELQLIFSMLMQAFRFEYPDKKEPLIEPGIIIKSKKPLLMKLHPSGI